MSLSKPPKWFMGFRYELLAGNKKTRRQINDDALVNLAGLAEMLELLLVLGGHNLQTHNYLPGPPALGLMASHYASGF